MSASDIFDALEAHDVDRLASLLDAGSDPNARKTSPPHWSPLHEAIEQLEDDGPIDSLVLLLRHGADVEAGGGDTPLLMALYRSQPRAVDLLLARGADTNVRGPEGDSPLRVASERGDVSTAAALLRCGATRTMDAGGGATGASALGIAARRLDLPLIELLLRCGADRDARDADDMTARDRLPVSTSDNVDALRVAESMLRSIRT